MKLSLSLFRTLFPIACAVLLSATASPAQVADHAAPPAPGATQTSAPGPRVVDPNAPAPPAAAPTVTNTPVQETPAPAAQLPPARIAGASGAPAPANTGAPYVIGPLDVLSIRVWGNQNLTGLVDVRPDGMISMPLIGELKADGTTVQQLRDMVTTKLLDFLNKPEVDIQVARINSKRFYIFGEVGRSGEFPLVGTTTVLDALSNAGGFRDFANQKKIYILRGTQKLFFNFKDVKNGKHMEQNIQIQNGDRIFVP
jgi:polysaccharide export outer membrane protein